MSCLAFTPVPEGLGTVVCADSHARRRERGRLYSSQLFCLPRLVVSSLEALESCFAVGPIIEKASYFFKARASVLKRQEVSGVVRGPKALQLKHIYSMILICRGDPEGSPA